MTTTQLLTVEQFWELEGVEGIQYELVEGELIEIPTPEVIHGYIAAMIVRLLGTYIDAHPLGFVFGDNTSYILRRDPDTLRIPDASFISFARGGITLPRRAWPTAPDIAVEVVSPSNREVEVREKVREYLAAGSQLVWVVSPDARTVTVYETDGVRELREGDALDGGDLLPGFAVSVARLFPPLPQGA